MEAIFDLIRNVHAAQSKTFPPTKEELIKWATYRTRSQIVQGFLAVGGGDVRGWVGG